MTKPIKLRKNALGGSTLAFSFAVAILIFLGVFGSQDISVLREHLGRDQKEKVIAKEIANTGIQAVRAQLALDAVGFTQMLATAGGSCSPSSPCTWISKTINNELDFDVKYSFEMIANNFPGKFTFYSTGNVSCAAAANSKRPCTRQTAQYIYFDPGVFQINLCTGGSNPTDFSNASLFKQYKYQAPLSVANNILGNGSIFVDLSQPVDDVSTDVTPPVNFSPLYLGGSIVDNPKLVLKGSTPYNIPSNLISRGTTADQTYFIKGFDRDILVDDGLTSLIGKEEKFLKNFVGTTSAIAESFAQNRVLNLGPNIYDQCTLLTPASPTSTGLAKPLDLTESNGKLASTPALDSPANLITRSSFITLIRDNAAVPDNWFSMLFLNLNTLSSADFGTKWNVYQSCANTQVELSACTDPNTAPQIVLKNGSCPASSPPSYGLSDRIVIIVRPPSGTLTINENITLGGAMFIVLGDVVVNGDLHLRGSLAVSGSLTVNGSLSLEPKFFFGRLKSNALCSFSYKVMEANKEVCEIAAYKNTDERCICGLNGRNPSSADWKSNPVCLKYIPHDITVANIKTGTVNSNVCDVGLDPNSEPCTYCRNNPCQDATPEDLKAHAEAVAKSSSTTVTYTTTSSGSAINKGSFAGGGAQNLGGGGGKNSTPATSH